MPRSEVEEDYRYKQLVAYNVVRSANSYLTYKRTEKSSESRLWRKYSLGIGGHINVEDKAQVTLFSTNNKKTMNFFTRTVWRELEEEIKIDMHARSEPRLVCFINDDSNDVGKVHFGLVWLLEVERPGAVKGKKGLTELRFCDIETLEKNKTYFETWSQLLIDHISSGKAF